MSEELSDIIVGNGIAAHAFLWTYARKLKMGHLDQARRLIWIKSPLVPTCSLTSTSLVSRAGLQYGVSIFGDQLLQAYEIFEDLCAHLPGVEKAKQAHRRHGDLENFKKRYGDVPGHCYIVENTLFLQTLEAQIKESLGHRLTIKYDTLLDHDDKMVYLHSKENIAFHQLFLMLGAGNKLYAKDPGGKSVVGQYAYALVDLGKESFVISRGPHNLIYRHRDQTLLVGSLDDKDDLLGWPLLAARSHGLKEILKTFDYDLPRNLNWTVVSGVRHKGIKRRPFWGEISKNVYSVHGLYKNGYSLSFLGAKGCHPTF